MGSRQPPPKDDLMDFFDVRKEFKKVYLQGPSSQGRVKREEMDEPPPDTTEEIFERGSDKKWQRFQEEQTRKLMDQAVGSVHGTCSEWSLARSGMSGIEADTMLGSVRGVRAREEEDLTKAFDFKKVAEGAWKLPIMDKREHILDKVNSNQIVVLAGRTGCGKTTQVPQFILDQHAREKKTVNIIVTQPRKIAARSVARRVCDERGWQLGGLVGYQVGLDKENKSPDTRLLYVTTGVLKKMIIAKKHLNEWTHIVLDEVHEREEDMDLVMLIVKKLLFSNSRNTKLILMSATMDELSYMEYFASQLAGPGAEVVPAPYVHVAEKGSVDANIFHYEKLQEFLAKFNINDRPIFAEDKAEMFDTCVKACKVLISKLDDFEMSENKTLGSRKRKEPGAVLVFLPGLGEIQVLRDHLKEKQEWEKEGGMELYCIPLHSSVPWEEHQKIFEPVRPGFRKVILSTNIAESSLTVPDVRYVVDFCLTKNMVAAEDTNYPQLRLEWASKNQMIQRAGRAGRVGHDGRVYRLITERFYQQLPEQHVPEIQRVPLSHVVLDVKMLDLGSPKELLALAMSPPKLSSLHWTILELKEIGALLTTVRGQQDREDGDLTVLGEIVAHLPLDIKLGKLIVLGHIFNVLEDSIVIASGLNGKSIFTAPFDKRVQAYKNKLFWADRTFSDCFAALLAYTTWDKYKRRGKFNMVDGVTVREEEFCRSNFLQKKQLVEMKMQVEEVTRMLKRMDIEPLQIQSPAKWNEDQRFQILRLVMFGAFYPNYFTKHSISEVEQQANKTLVGKDPRNTVYFQGFENSQMGYGVLYEDQVKRLLEAATTEKDKINLTFDGRKIFVEFERDLLVNEKSSNVFGVDKEQGKQRWNMTGDIMHQVYVSVKLRAQGGPLHTRRPSLYLYSEEVAKQKIKEWETLRLTGSRSSTLTTELIGQAEPPSPEVTKIEVVPVHVSSPNRFWVHYRDNWEQEDWEDRLQFSVGELVKRGKMEGARPGDVKRGDVYLVQWSEEGYDDVVFYRARVDSLHSSNATVFFIDYGNVEMVAVDKLMVISERMAREYKNLVETPGLAVECSLAGVQPSRVRSSKGLWDDEAVNRFKSLIEEGSRRGRLMGEIYSVTKAGSGQGKFVVALQSLKITHATSEDSVDIKEILKMEKLADTAVESYLSKQDHNERKQFAQYNDAMKEHLRNYAKFKKVPRLPTVMQDSSKQHLKVTLNGPFSPLEHKVTCAYRHGACKLTQVGPDSVNAVMLDQAPGDPHDHWMVASYVEVSANGETLLARNTSWLPSTPGMGALATMMFSPHVELRHNTDRTKLTGFLAGLGPRTNWGKRGATDVTKVEKTHAFYPEHDMEVKFDVDVSNEDIHQINTIRYCINQMLQWTETDNIMALTQPKALDAVQKKIKECLEEVLEKEREYKPKEGLACGKEYRWNLLQPGLRLPSQTLQEAPVFTLIDGVRLKKGQGVVAKERLEQVIHLWQKASRTDNSLLPTEVECPACPGKKMETPREIFDHLRTRSHDEREKLIMKEKEEASSSGIYR